MTCRWCQEDDAELVELHVLGLSVLERIAPACGSQTSSTRYLQSVLDWLVKQCNCREITYEATDAAAEKPQRKVSLNDFLAHAQEVMRELNTTPCDCRIPSMTGWDATSVAQC